MLLLDRSLLVVVGRFPPALLDMSKVDLISGWPKKKWLVRPGNNGCHPSLFPTLHSLFQHSAQIRSPQRSQGVLSAAPAAFPRLYTSNPGQSPLFFLQIYLKNLDPRTLELGLWESFNYLFFLSFTEPRPEELAFGSRGHSRFPHYSPQRPRVINMPASDMSHSFSSAHGIHQPGTCKIPEKSGWGYQARWVSEVSSPQNWGERPETSPALLSDPHSLPLPSYAEAAGWWWLRMERPNSK